MEVKLDKRWPIDAPVDAAWAVLGDIHATAACMPGAQITEQVDATHYKGTVKSKVGPAVMVFQGEIELQGLDAAERRLKMLGKGSDRGGSTASMALLAQVLPGDGPGTCMLTGEATVTVSGKLAQFGSRLLVPVSDAMLAQFADNFRAAAADAARAMAGADAPRPDDAIVQSADGAAGIGAAASAAATPQAVAAGTDLALAERAGGAAVPAALAVATAPVATADAPASRAVAPASPAAMAARPAATPRPVKELNALALLWAVVKGWFAGLFGKRA
jgi:hypothetical protein